jgi:DNA-binding beta-propeller fold protein YncE
MKLATRIGPASALLGALCSMAGAVSATSSAAYELSSRIGLGAGKHWDYVLADGATRRLYLARGERVEVIDLQSHARVGQIGGLRGTHGVAVASELGLGFVSDGKANAVAVFDLATLALVRTVAVGRNPDAIVFDAATQRVAVFNGTSHDASILDAASGEVMAGSIALGGKPEFARSDGAGHVYVNIQDTAEVVELDLRQALVRRRYSIAPCLAPTGLAIDAGRRLYSVCSNHLMIISDPTTGSVLGSAPIGARPDGVVCDEGFAYSANGGDGTITVVGETHPGEFAAVATIASEPSARTIDVDRRTHALYLPAAAAGGTASPDELEILVFTRR